jgi:hypothetical protein
MNDDRTNALLTLAGGLLALLAAIIPIIRAIFKKLQEAPNKDRIIATIQLILECSLLIGGAALAIFSPLKALGLVLVFISVLISIRRFIKQQDPPSRRSIILEVLIPVAYFAYLFLEVRVGTLSKMISVNADKKEVEQVGTGQPATRPESKSEDVDKPQPESEGHSR